tara:strand:- start:37 stop:1830 length:1794 start_codon:yes stop_codon:yes gene_type:complete
VAESILVVKVDSRQAVKPLNAVSKAATTGKQKVDNLGKSAVVAQKKLGSLKGTASQLGTVLRGVAGIALVGFLKGAANAAASFESETLLLQQGLKNVGAGAGELDKLQQSADRLGKETLFNEDDFRKGFGLLTSFGNIGVSTYDSVAMAAANVAQVSGTDVSSAFMQLAKAINDPVTNLSALSRSGIQFTDQQKTTIKSLVETGQAAKAQAMILKELEKQYGGTAAAAAGGAAGVQDTFGEAMYDLQKAVGGVVNTALPPFLKALTTLINAFTALPGPVQAIIVGVGALAAVFVLLAPAIAAIGPALVAIKALGLGATIAGWLGAIGPVIAVVKAFGIAVAGVLSGPVGIVLLLVAAGAAIYAFRDQIAEALKPIGDFFMAAFNIVGNVLTKAAQFYMDSYVKPVLGFGQKLFDGFVGLFTKIADVVKAPFLTVVNFIKGIFNNVLSAIGKGVNGAIGMVNRLISGFNRLPAPIRLFQSIPLIPQMTVPQFAKGGVVNGPTLAMVGEGGEPEYIIPQSKAAGFANNFLSGSRGSAAIPQFADGGFVGPINIQTGPVMQQDNETYLTMGQFEEGMRELTESLARGGRSYGSRQFQGVS